MYKIYIWKFRVPINKTNDGKLNNIKSFFRFFYFWFFSNKVKCEADLITFHTWSCDLICLIRQLGFICIWLNSYQSVAVCRENMRKETTCSKYLPNMEKEKFHIFVLFFYLGRKGGGYFLKSTWTSFNFL